MSLFQKSVEKKYLNELDPALVYKKFNDFQSYFGNTEIQENIRNSKEEEFQEGFIRELFVNILNYTLKPKPGFNIVLEKKNVDDSRKADAAIINNFSTDGLKPTDGLKSTDGLTRQLQAIAVIAVIELKSTSTTDLDTVETQAFGYKNHHPKCVYVITSNFEKLRFYIQNAVDYLEFDLFNLSKKQFSLLWLCLSKDNILNDLPLRIKESSVLQEENVTKKLYADYSKFREAIFENIVKNNSNNINNGINPVVDTLTLFKKTQKLLDRFLFIFFAEDRLLLPPNSISEIIKQWTTLKEDLDAYVPLYERFKKYFSYMNTGFKGKKYDIFPYNGGLFFPDEILDNINIDDNILHEHTLKLSAYDFETDIDVNILGHIFEHSLTEIENVQAKLRGEQIDKQKTKRKKDGIFYTPKYITKYIVENTVGKLCEEKRNELEIIDEEYAKGRKNRKKDTIKSLDEKLNAYRNWLLSLTILDPACGSGAFLNQALEFLINEHKKIDELRAQLFGGGIVFSDITNEILEKNIYGVDLNEESVDIAKLSLWLRTARKGRKLNTLNNNIKCGNSLIDDPEVAGEKAFDWQKEFPHVFEKKDKKAWHVVFAIHNSRYVQFTDGLTRRFVHRFEPGFIAYTYPKLDLHEEEILADCLNEVVKEKQLNILACNICEDHVHAIIVCEKEELEKNIGQWKGRTAYLYNRRVNPSIDDQQPEYADGTKQKLWAKSFHPVEITDDTQMQNTLYYIKNNREKHDLPEPTDGLTRRLKEMTCTPDHAFRTEYKGGFDLVIGNPPYTYRNAITKKEKEYYKKKYKSIEGNFDLYKIFIERIVNINKDNGYASFIIPNTFLTAKTYKKLREILINNFAILEFFDLGLDVFENVVVESIIFKLKKIQTPNQITEIKIQRDRSRYFKYLQDNYNIDLLKYSGDDFLFNTNISTKISPIIDKMFNDIKLLGKLCYCTVGINTGYIKSELTSEYKIDVRYHKMLNGKNIGRNFIDWDNEWIMYDIDFVKSQGERGRALPPEYIFLNDKILVQRTRRGMKRKLVCYYDNEQFYNLNRLSNIVLENNNYSLKYIYSLLNSTLMDFFFNNFFNEYEVKPSHLAKLPIKETENQQPFIEKADLMLSLNKELQTKAGKFIKRIKANLNPAVYHIPNSGVNPAAERQNPAVGHQNPAVETLIKITKKLQNFYDYDFTTFVLELKKQKIKLTFKQQDEWEDYFDSYKQEITDLQNRINQTDKEIDQMVYELYGLTEEEIKIVEVEA